VQGFMIRPKSARIAYDSREPRSVFVAIEGLDGCGKSTVARLLARRIQAFYYPTPPPLYRKIRHAVDGSHSRVEHFHFYVAALIRASREIEMLLEQGPVVADRYLASTAAYHAPWLNGDLRVLDGLPIIAPRMSVSRGSRVGTAPLRTAGTTRCPSERLHCRSSGGSPRSRSTLPIRRCRKWFE